MDVDSFGKSGKTARKSRKGKVMATTAGRRPRKRSKGKSKNGTGNGAGSLEGDQAEAVEQQPQPALASSLDLAASEKLGGKQHLDSEGWLRWTYDTGAAISAFPLDAKDWH